MFPILRTPHVGKIIWELETDRFFFFPSQVSSAVTWLAISTIIIWPRKSDLLTRFFRSLRGWPPSFKRRVQRRSSSRRTQVGNVSDLSLPHFCGGGECSLLISIGSVVSRTFPAHFRPCQWRTIRLCDQLWWRDEAFPTRRCLRAPQLRPHRGLGPRGCPPRHPVLRRVLHGSCLQAGFLDKKGGRQTSALA